MATAISPTVVIKRLDKMLVLLATPDRWIKGANHVKKDLELLTVDKKTKRTMMAYCLRGAAIAAGNGAQLYWELAWTIDRGELLKSWNESWGGYRPGSIADDKIVGFNDAKTTDYKMVRSVIVRTRARIKRYGLLALPKKAKAA